MSSVDNVRRLEVQMTPSYIALGVWVTLLFPHSIVACDL